MSGPNETWAPPTVIRDGAVIDWTGPNEDDLAADGVSLVRRVPWERWPYGGPDAHEGCCNMFRARGLSAGLYCDCESSAADDEEYGVSP